MIHVLYCHVYLDTHYDRVIFIDLLKNYIVLYCEVAGDTDMHP